MTSLKGDLRSIMGTPFGGVGHAVLIFSRVTRAAFNSDSVVLQLHDRIEMPEEADGKFHVDGLDPGPIRIELEGGTVHNHGWNIDLPDEGVWSLTDLVDAQVDWSPAVIGRAEAAAREAREHADRAEAGADRVGTAEQVGVWASEASSSASAAASARSAAQTARNASQSARDAAQGHANRAATSESNAAASESNAKQSETNAGDFAAVATTAATEAVGAMESASDAADSIANNVSEAAGHAYRASQSESGAAAYAQNASDAADRAGTAEQVGTWAQQAQDAADRIGTAETVEGWADDARNSASSASTSESKAKEYRDAAFSAASSTADELRGDLINIKDEASSRATESSRSAARAKTSETNAATHEANSLSAAQRAESAAEETIQQVEGDFATRNYVDNVAWPKSPPEVVDMSRDRPDRVAVKSLDELPSGQFALLNHEVADLIGSPLRGQGLVTSWPLGTHTYQRAEISEGSNGARVVRAFTRYRDSAGWGEWEESGRAVQAMPYVSPPPAGFRLAPLALTLGNGGGRAPATGSFRIPVTYAPAISRWRLRVSSRQPRSGETSGGEYRVNKIAIGPRGGGGSYTAAPTIVAENIVVPANGEAAATPWMNMNIGSGQNFILGFEYQTLSGDTPWTLTGGSWDVGASAADEQSPSSSTLKAWAPLDWWIEAEVPATTPVIAALGDSLTCGVGAGLPIYDSWLSQYCRGNGVLPMHLSASGDSTHMTIPTPQAYKLTRWHHLHRPDALIWAMGSNDFANGYAASSTQALVEEAVASILPNESINLYATTIMPRAAGQYTSSQDAERVKFNNWIKGERNLFRDVFDFATVVDDGAGHLKSEYNSDGIHLLSAGYTALANAITRPVVPSKTQSDHAVLIPPADVV